MKLGLLSLFSGSLLLAESITLEPIGVQTSALFKGSDGIKNLLDASYVWRYGFLVQWRSFCLSMELSL